MLQRVARTTLIPALSSLGVRARALMIAPAGAFQHSSIFALCCASHISYANHARALVVALRVAVLEEGAFEFASREKSLDARAQTDR